MRRPDLLHLRQDQRDEFFLAERINGLGSHPSLNQSSQISHMAAAVIPSTHAPGDAMQPFARSTLASRYITAHWINEFFRDCPSVLLNKHRFLPGIEYVNCKKFESTFS